MKKNYLAALLAGLMVVVTCFTGCSGQSDEETTADLAQMFMVALYSQDAELAKEICNETGYATYEALSGMLAMASMGMYQEMAAADRDAMVANIIANVDVMDVKIINENRAVVTLLSMMTDEPQRIAIPLEKDADGEWKVAVTKAAFNG